MEEFPFNHLDFALSNGAGWFGLVAIFKQPSNILLKRLLFCMAELANIPAGPARVGCAVDLGRPDILRTAGFRHFLPMGTMKQDKDQ